MPGMKLPNAENARVDEDKIAGYLLSETHPDGRSKAEFFRGFGFKVEEWQLLAKELQAHGQRYDVQNCVESKFGTRYSVDGEIETPSRRRPRIRSVWIVNKGSTTPRLITAHPA